jgi:UDP-N-acetylmuramoylalanine--D-glutamate ligase
MEHIVAYSKEREAQTLAARHYDQIRIARQRNLQAFIEESTAKIHHNVEIATIRGVKFLDDCASVTANSTWFSLESLSTSIILIMGCESQCQLRLTDYEDLATLIPTLREKVRIIVNVGDAQYAKPFVGIVPTIINVRNVEDAVKCAYLYAAADESVVYSPSLGDRQQTDTNAHIYARAVNEL